jgi:type II secretory pathway component PulF
MPLHEAFKQADTDPLLWRTIAIGTEAGSLDNSLARYIDITQEEFSRFLDTLTAAVEPFALIFVGCLVGFIVISLYLPMFDMIPALMGTQ